MEALRVARLAGLAGVETLPATGSDEWWDLFSDTGLKEDRYIKAIQIKPDSVAAYKVVHHAHQYMVDANLSENPSWTTSNNDVSLNEYSIGKRADIFPDDAGRLINPDIVRQQIESGLLWGLASALGHGVTFTRGLPDQANFDALGLPRLKGTPEIEVELIPSNEAPGGVSDLAVPVAAPAIANAIFSATGKRLRRLPLTLA